ncbi:MAG: NADH:flavin oxidoreductase [Alphaproteobacteria bacterium]|jgi:2,4-dienoyl-CoA reductase-like NADH-dependent reductase (Old Yellow Enzyme family)
MTDRHPTLFSPGTLGPLALANRALVAPMTRASANADGRATDQMRDYYRNFGAGGWGLVETEAAYIDLAYSQGYDYQPGIADDAQAEAWVKIVEAVHAEGTPIMLQLFHCGAINQGNHWVEGSIAPSAVQPKGSQIDRYRGGEGPFQMPREITRDEMAQVVESFAAAARRGVEIGFDAIEMHGANGYLPDQFLTVHTNLRDDEYGGPVENRVRFHCDVLRAMRAAVPGTCLGVRISQTKVNDFDYSWPGGADDAQAIFSALAATGIDFLHCSAHLGVTPVFGTTRSLSGLARDITGLPVITNGKLQDADVAEQALIDGEGDFVSVAKGALADPAWAAKTRDGIAPVAFDPGMITPLATLDNYYQWLADNPGGVARVKTAPRDKTETV